MKHTSRRRAEADPLSPVPQPTWLVVRDRHSAVVDATPLEPNADLRSALIAAREARIAAGWNAAPIGARNGFFFCELEGDRRIINIEMHDPRLPPPLGHGRPQ